MNAFAVMQNVTNLMITNNHSISIKIFYFLRFSIEMLYLWKTKKAVFTSLPSSDDTTDQSRNHWPVSENFSKIKCSRKQFERYMISVNFCTQKTVQTFYWKTNLLNWNKKKKHIQIKEISHQTKKKRSTFIILSLNLTRVFTAAIWTEAKLCRMHFSSRFPYKISKEAGNNLKA